MSEWQPIATAPKDGCFLVCDNTLKGDDFFITVASVWMEGDVYFVDITSNDEYVDYAGNPTHWMPLPNPPILPSEHPSEP